MSANNSILPFADTAVSADILTDAAYNTDAQRRLGHQLGDARRQLTNKHAKQTSIIAASIAQFIANHQGSDVSDAVPFATLADMMTAAVATVSSASTQAASTVTVSPVGGISSTNVQAALAELDAEKASVSHTQAATTVTVAPVGGISSTNVQAALAELDTEKASVSHTQAASTVTVIPTGGITATDVQAAIAQLDSKVTTGIGYVPLDTAGSNSMTASLNFSGTGLRMRGDMSNATLNSRFAIQTNVNDAPTAITVMPQGSGNESRVQLFSGSDLNNSQLFDLDMNGATGTARVIASRTGSAGWPALTLLTTSQERLRIAADGNVGIGQTNPTTKLDLLCSTNFGFKISDGTMSGIFTPSSLGGMALFSSGNHPLIFGSNNLERMRIQASGDVNIGSNQGAGDALRYFDVQNASGGTASGAIVRLITNNAANGSVTTGYVVKYRTGAMYIGNEEPTSAGTLILQTVAGDVVMAPGAMERMRILASGSVGVGTASPSQGFDVAWPVMWVGTKTANPGSAGTIRFRDDTGAARWAAGILGAAGQTKYSVYDMITSSERFTIDASGNIGIGITTPQQKLHVDNIIQIGGRSDAGYYGYLQQSTNSLVIAANGDQSYRATLGTNNGSGNIVFKTANNAQSDTERMRILANGQVGIGTASVSGNAAAEIYGASYDDGDAKGTLVLSSSASFAANAGSGVIFRAKYNGAGAFFNAGAIKGIKENATDGNFAGALVFTTQANGASPAEAMRITSDKVLTIGSAALNVSYPLRVYTPDGGGILSVPNWSNNQNRYIGGTGAGDVWFSGYKTGTNSYDTTFNGGVTASGNITTNYFLYSANAQVSGLAGSGNRAVYSTPSGALTNSASDGTMKHECIPLTDCLSRVLKWQPISFKWVDSEKFGDQREIGFIAQDMLDVTPEVVGMNSDGTLSVDYPKLVAELAGAIAELNAKLEALMKGSK